MKTLFMRVLPHGNFSFAPVERLLQTTVNSSFI